MDKFAAGWLFPGFLTVCVALALSPRELHAQETQETHEGGAEAATEAEESHGDEAGGGPPMDFQTDLALWSLVAFVVFLWILKRYAWGPLVEGLDRRDARVRQELIDAEESRRKAQQMLAEHQKKLDQVQDEVREIIAEARRDAEHTKQDIVETAQREAEATRNRTLREITQAKESALEELFSRIADEVTEATERVLGRSLTEADQSRLVDEALADLPRR